MKYVYDQTKRENWNLQQLFLVKCGHLKIMDYDIAARFGVLQWTSVNSSIYRVLWHASIGPVYWACVVI